jgi:hypothetical protein
MSYDMKPQLSDTVVGTYNLVLEYISTLKLIVVVLPCSSAESRPLSVGVEYIFFCTRLVWRASHAPMEHRVVTHRDVIAGAARLVRRRKLPGFGTACTPRRDGVVTRLSRGGVESWWPRFVAWRRGGRICVIGSWWR